MRWRSGDDAAWQISSDRQYHHRKHLKLEIGESAAENCTHREMATLDVSRRQCGPLLKKRRR